MPDEPRTTLSQMVDEEGSHRPRDRLGLDNHQRFVRGEIASWQDFPRYEQEKWVRIQSYQSARWHDLIDLWRAYNTHLLHVAGCMSGEGQAATCKVGGERRK